MLCWTMRFGHLGGPQLMGIEKFGRWMEGLAAWKNREQRVSLYVFSERNIFILESLSYVLGQKREFQA